MMSAEALSRYGNANLAERARNAGAERRLYLPSTPVITGMAGLTGFGDGPRTFRGICNLESAVGTIITMVGGKEVRRVASPADFDPTQYFDRKEIQRISKGNLMTMFLVEQAGLMAGILGLDGKLKPEFDGDFSSTTVATAMESVSGLVDVANTLEKGTKRIRPLEGLGTFLGQRAFYVSKQAGLRGWGNSSTEACATGLSSIADAAEQIRTGRSDIVLAGGVDDTLSNHPELSTEIFDSFGAYAHRKGLPHTASRPFDRDRNGIVIGSGGAVFVVERMDQALARGATIHAVILGAEKGMDANDAVLADPQRNARQIFHTLERRGEGEKGYYSTDLIVAHATATKGDAIEVEALRNVYGEDLNQIPITAPKSALGHLLGGAGAISMLLAIMALKEGIIPPTLNLDNSEFPELNIVKTALRKDIQTALVLANGMGGHNASVLIGKY
jgi:3-oxoacyl-(acyl-carrier-protein) synthase